MEKVMEVKKEITIKDKKNKYRRYLSGEYPIWRQKHHNITGLFITATMVVVMEVLYLLDIIIPNITGLFAIAVVYSVYAKSLRVGLISAVINLIYSIFYFLVRSPSITHQLYYPHAAIHGLTIVVIFVMTAALNKNLMKMNRELIVNQKQLARAEENSIIMVAYSDIEGRITRVPDNFCSFLGYSEDELLSMRFQDITHPEDLNQEGKKIDELFKGKTQSFELKKRYLKKNGDYVWAYVNISMITDEEGKPLACMAYVKDLDSYEKAAEKLRESEEKLRRITENMSDMIYQTDKKGIKVYVSPSCKRVIGYDPDELINHSSFDYIHHEDIDYSKEFFKSILMGLEPGKIEFRHRHKNGHYIWLEVLGNVLLSEDEKVMGAIFTSRDITNRKVTERALMEGEERYRLLVELSPDAVVVHQSSKYIFANQAAARLLGLNDPQEIIGRDIMDFLHEDYHDMASQRIQKVMEGGTVPLVEEKLVRKDKSTVYVEIAAIPFEYKGKMAIQAVIRDITDRKKAEELQRSVIEQEKRLQEAKEYDKIKTEFFANISHELRTPLNVILGTLQLLKLYLNEETIIKNNPNILKHIHVMKQNCYRLVRLISNLIDVTKIDAGFYQLQLQNCEIIETIKEITLSVAGYIESKDITLEFDTQIEEMIIAVDPDKIERILLNLLSNAVKFTKPGGRIKVTAAKYEKYIRIAVSDTGIGIPKDKINLIFQRFRQVDKSLARNHEGSGIGLSLVRSLVNMHGGVITVNSQYGKGSKFIIQLPIKKLNGNYSSHQKACSNQGSERIERIHVEFSDIYS